MPPPCDHAENEHTPATNRICQLWLYDPEYNRLWGGDGDILTEEKARQKLPQNLRGSPYFTAQQWLSENGFPYEAKAIGWVRNAKVANTITVVQLQQSVLVRHHVDCKSRGEDTGLRECPTCNGKVMVKLFQCLHPQRGGEVSVRDCDSCQLYEKKT